MTERRHATQQYHAGRVGWIDDCGELACRFGVAPFSCQGAAAHPCQEVRVSLAVAMIASDQLFGAVEPSAVDGVADKDFGREGDREPIKTSAQHRFRDPIRPRRYLA